MPADSKVEHHLPPTASCLMDDGPSRAVEQGTGLKGTCPQKLKAWFGPSGAGIM